MVPVILLGWLLLLPCPRGPAVAPDRPVAALRDEEGGAPRVPPAPREWHRFYRAIEDPDARSFLEAALEAGREWLGEPAVAITEVHLRLSEPRDPGDPGRAGGTAPGARLRSGFRLTETVDLEKGIFAIYLSAKPGDAAFRGQLAHEAFHLFEPRLRDVYIEGLNTWLTRRLFARLGLEWRPWEEHFARGGDPLYGTALALFDELEAIVGKRALPRILRCTVPTDGGERGGHRRQVAIDTWLLSLPHDQRAAARDAILKHYPVIEEQRWKTHRDCAFIKPGEAAAGSAPGRDSR